MVFFQQFCVSISSLATTRIGSWFIIFYFRNQVVIFQKFLKHQKSNRCSQISEGLTYAKIRLQKHEFNISLSQLSVMWNDKWEWNGLSVWSFNTFSLADSHISWRVVRCFPFTNTPLPHRKWLLQTFVRITIVAQLRFIDSAGIFFSALWASLSPYISKVFCC